MIGPHDDTARIELSPWPFIPSGKTWNLTLQFTPGKVPWSFSTEI